MRLGIAHHFGWAVAVTADDDGNVVDRRRIELIGPGLPPAPIHHHGGAHPLHGTAAPLADEALAALVAQVRASVERASSDALDEVASALPAPIRSLALRAAPADFPVDIATLRRVPYESRADSILYLDVLADLARARGWTIHRYDPQRVEREATELLGARAHDVLHGPRVTWGAPWSKDHRTALAAAILAP